MTLQPLVIAHTCGLLSFRFNQSQIEVIQGKKMYLLTVYRLFLDSILWALQYKHHLHSIYIALGSTSNLEII
jgi:hypothetical protein